MIAFGSMLTNALVEIGDRLREISTLRVLGYRPRQVAGILFRQMMILFVFGLVLVLPLGYGMLRAISVAYNTEVYRMPVIVRPMAVIYTTATALVFVLLAQAVVHWRIISLDWLEGVTVKE